MLRRSPVFRSPPRSRSAPRAPSRSPQAPATVTTVPGMPPVPDPSNLYSEIATGKMSAAVAGDLPRVYVPHVRATTST